MRIIEARPEHVAEVWRILSACVRAMRREGIQQWDEFYPTEALVAEDARNGTLFVAEDGGACVAAVCLDGNEPPEYAGVEWSGGGPVLVVHRLCVDPSRQGRGVGGQLLDFAEELARSGGRRWVRLDAYSGNPRLIGMYERRGYRRAGRIHFPRRELPFYCFEKDLGGGGPA